MVQHSRNPSRQTTSSPSSSSSRPSGFHEYVSRRRCLLGLLAVVVILVMIIGVLFAAHQYYHDFGGAGFLKVRNQHQELGVDLTDTLYLPLRKREVWEEQWQSYGWNKRQNVPFFECGDKENSCEQFGQPTICCPVEMICYPTASTPSGIFCCNSSASEFDCAAAERNNPQCMASLVECSASTGGGCCPAADICSPNGCIHTSTASILNSTTSSITSGPGNSTFSSSSTTASMKGTPITVTNTVTELPAATSTEVKEGEIAELASGSKESVMGALFIPYSSIWLLVGVAGLMTTL